MNILLSYLAGYIDGDGCFYTGKNINPIKYRYGIYISSTNKDTLRYFKEIFGGNVVFGKPNKRFKTYNPINQWYIGGLNAQLLAKSLLPFLNEKKKDAQIFIEFAEASSHQIKDELRNLMKIHRKNSCIITPEVVVKINSCEKTSEPTEENFAYLAGFVDSECSLILSRYMNKNRPNLIYKAILHCNNTNYCSIVFLKNIFGGFCGFVSRKAKNALHKDQICWRISAKQLKPILPKIQPYLKNKVNICNKLIEFTSTIMKNGGDRQKDHPKDYQKVLEVRESLYNQISHLNSKSTI